VSGIVAGESAESDAHWPAIRRVVTGLDSEGRSCVLLDATINPVVRSEQGSVLNIWRSLALPADNAGSDDKGSGDFALGQLCAPGSSFLLVHYPPGVYVEMHATDTLDYMVVMFGEVTLVLDTGETVLRAGDVLVDRGIVHGWRNDSSVPAVAAVAIVPALPVGRGATLNVSP
jgi:quercetin dioxygenase-like cupin family protein